MILLFIYFFNLKHFLPLCSEVLHSAKCSDNTETLALLFQMWFTVMLQMVLISVKKTIFIFYTIQVLKRVNHNKNTTHESCILFRGDECGKCCL